ncbi:casA [Candida oxycetoniae]|uniref:Metacaspase-1 n=1 Tax=Candida oxycetoniae TaxID=497107 RepID=A0AAI9SWZ5_9ASCO|nr:casA [Candida oxycetoniae]KAI3404294.2 casA [Candida oxycetoniae]
MFPGQGRYTYGGQRPPMQQQQQPYYNAPPGPPPFNGGYYPPPQGAPPPNSWGYERPSGPPPSSHNYSNAGGYQRPSNPPPQQQQQQQQYGARSEPGYNGEPDYGHRYGSGNYTRPPSQQQSFGVDNYNYRYSNCNGRKKALLVGINYIGTSNELKGPINDVNNVENFLLRHGFSSDNIVKLTDNQRIQRAIPTRKNILDAIQWLVKDAKPNDSLFFHFSGHGGQTADQPDQYGNYDEDDGYDEVIYPLDFETNGFIIDDLLHDMMIKTLPPGCRLTALFDSCHSGSVLDLPYMYSTKGVLKEPNVMAEAGSGLLQAAMSYASGNSAGILKGLGSTVKSFMNEGRASKAEKVSKQTKTAPCDAISFSGCKDNQTSADSRENGQAIGAMSYAFLTVMNQNPNQSYLSLLQNMRAILQSKYSQKPQLTASHPIDCNLQFIF